jgi:hypothetical protein
MLGNNLNCKSIVGLSLICKKKIQDLTMRKLIKSSKRAEGPKEPA